MALSLMIFGILFLSGTIGLIFGNLTQQGFFVLWGAIFLLLSAVAVVSTGGILLGESHYYDVDGVYQTTQSIWSYSDFFLFWFTTALIVISGIHFYGMVGSMSKKNVEQSVYHW